MLGVRAGSFGMSPAPPMSVVARLMMPPCSARALHDSPDNATLHDTGLATQPNRASGQQTSTCGPNLEQPGHIHGYCAGRQHSNHRRTPSWDALCRQRLQLHVGGG